LAEDATQTSLIRTKLHKPIILGNYVHRQRLLDQLDHHIQRPLSLVVAPAGYGKSVLVSCWLEASRSPSAWVSLDESDNDLRLFLSYFLAAVRTIFPDAGQKIKPMVKALKLPPVPVLATSLINELDQIEKPFILVLDDFHIIKDKAVIDLLSQFLSHPPKAIHLVLVGRRDPSLATSKMRARNLMIEIRTQDLRFNTLETESFLTQELGVRVDSSTAAVLSKKVEGWVTGLRLAALSMHHQARVDPKLLEPQVDTQYVMEYLFTEVFSHQPSGITQYLIATSILNRFCGPLCEALCVQGSEPVPGEISGWEFIAWLKKENIFLIPLDAENRWFRFHHLFQKLLFNQLKRRLGPEDIKVLYARASVWFAENGLIEDALKHALDGGDSATAARLVAEHGFDLVSEEQWLTLQRWLNLLPKYSFSKDLGLTILEAWTHMVFSEMKSHCPALTGQRRFFPLNQIYLQLLPIWWVTSKRCERSSIIYPLRARGL
jgi:LuxR family maltose regulon positive regulatory protein